MIKDPVLILFVTIILSSVHIGKTEETFCSLIKKNELII